MTILTQTPEGKVIEVDAIRLPDDWRPPSQLDRDEIWTIRRGLEGVTRRARRLNFYYIRLWEHRHGE